MTKEHILQEIRRTAEANGGVSLGWRRFFRETGIKECDWKGKYWARWSDAVREVGLTPNKRTTAYDDSLLLGKYADFVRELGRLPIIMELRLKVRSDATFPNDKTFERFGTKSEFIDRLTKYCQGRVGYEEVVRLCLEYEPSVREKPVESSSSGETIGGVYLIKSGRYYKIGRSNSAGITDKSRISA